MTSLSVVSFINSLGSRVWCRWHPLVVNTTYRSVYETAHNLSDVSPHPTVSEIKLEFPTTSHQILAQFRDHIKSLAHLRKGITRNDTPDKRTAKSPKCVAIIDSIISNPGAYLPWKEMVKICKEEGIWSVIDAAHSIGQEQDIDLRSADPDFWVSVGSLLLYHFFVINFSCLKNCHKWLHCKRSVAMLYIPERYLLRFNFIIPIITARCLHRNRHIIKTSLPTSHAYRPVKDRSLQYFLAQFECTWFTVLLLEMTSERLYGLISIGNGTIDFIPYLAVAYGAYPFKFAVSKTGINHWS